MKRYIVNLDNSEPLTIDADWARPEGNALVMYVATKPIAFFSLYNLVSLEIVGELQTEMPAEIPAPPMPEPVVEEEPEE